MILIVALFWVVLPADYRALSDQMMLPPGICGETFHLFFFVMDCFNYVCSDICVCMAQVGMKKCSQLTDQLLSPCVGWGHNTIVWAKHLGCGTICMAFWTQERVMIDLFLTRSLWKVNPGFRQCQEESLLITVNLILIRQQAFIALVQGPWQVQ